VEFERVIAQTLPAVHHCPLDDAPRYRPARQAVDSMPEIDRVFIVGIDFRDVHRVLAAAEDVVRRSRSTYIYVFDALLDTRKLTWPNAVLTRIPWYRAISKLPGAQLFIPVGGMVDRMSDILDRQVHFLPIGVDTTLASPRVPRSIDVNAYGRQPVGVLDELQAAMPRERLLYWTAHTDLGHCHDLEGQRDMFWKLLSRSRVALAYDPMAEGRSGRFNSPFVGQRWFESLAAGCVVMGKAPRCPETAELFDWPDAVVELGGTWAEQARAIIDLAADDEAVARIRERNLSNIGRHDWRVRLAHMVG
jgi:hypothetical protein